MTVRVTTRFMAIETFRDEFPDFATAKQFVDREIEKLQAFYKTVINRQTVHLVIQKELTMRGDMIVRVLHPAPTMFGTTANFLVLFRIDNGLVVEPIEEKAEPVAV